MTYIDIDILKLINSDILTRNFASTRKLNFALILSGILLRLTPERAPRTVLRDERPENLGGNLVVNPVHFLLTENIKSGNQGIIT
jgi:hypothetical protein